MKTFKNHLRYQRILLNIAFLVLSNLASAQTDIYKVYGNDNSDELGEISKIGPNSLIATGYISNGHSQGMFCSKLDVNGNIIWNKVFGTLHSKGYTIYSLNSQIFIGGTNLNNNGNAEIHCIDTNGSLSWAKEFVLSGNEDIVSMSNIDDTLVLVGTTSAFGNAFDIREPLKTVQAIHGNN